MPQVSNRPGQIQHGDLQLLAGMADPMSHVVSFALCIYEQPTRQIERRGIGKELIEVGVGNAHILNPFVLGVADERATLAVPPGDVGLQLDTATLVEGDAPDAVIGPERTVRETERFAEREGYEVLEHSIYVHQKNRLPGWRLVRFRWSSAGG